jgi:putative membrane protein
MLPLATAAACFGPGFAPGLAPFFLLIPLFWLIVLVLVVTLVARRWRHGWEGGSAPWSAGSPSRRAEAVLAERFARGEIDEAEYHARLDALRAG